MILPSICMCPIDFETGYRRKSKKQFRFIGFMQAGWKEQKKSIIKTSSGIVRGKENDWKYLPNRMIKKLLGEKNLLENKRMDQI